MRYSFYGVISVAALLSSSHIHAVEVGLTLYEESEYTTNSGRTDSDEVEEWIHSPGATVTATHEGPSLNMDVNYTLTRRYYEQDLYDDETEAAGSANLVWSALPERLDFTVNHTRTQTSIRSINAATPDNRQETTNTSAGPTLRFNPRGDDQLLIQYLWGDRSSEDTDNDAETHTTDVSYALAMSSTSSLIFSAINEQVQYENPFAPDIEYNTGQVSWNRVLSNLTYTLTGGYTKAERTEQRDDVDGTIFDAILDWQARPTTLVSLTAGRSIDDQSTALSSGRFIDDREISTNSDLAEVFTNDRAGITVVQQLGGRTNLTLAATLDREDYEDIARDTEREVLRLGLTRQLNRKMDLSFDIAVEKEDFEDEGDEAETLRSDLTLAYAIGRRLNLDFGVRYEERDSDSGFNNRNYDEWRGFVRISYIAIDPAR